MFSINLKNELYFNSMTLKDLAKITEIPYSRMITYVSKEKRLPNIVDGVKIAKCLNCTVEELVDGYTHNKNIQKTFKKNKYEKIQPLIDEILLLPPDIINSLQIFLARINNERRKCDLQNCKKK